MTKAMALGWNATELSEHYLDDVHEPPAVRARLNSLRRVGRVGAPSDSGELAVVLAIDNSRF